VTEGSSIEQVGVEAKRVLAEENKAVLSTFSKKYPDYPFGSMVPFILDEQGYPIILISRLAQHTQNILSHGNISFLVMEQQAEDAQQDARLTILGEAVLVEEGVDAIAAVYYQRFPHAEGYHTVLDFRFFRVMPSHIRWVGGFGQARWLSPSVII